MQPTALLAFLTAVFCQIRNNLARNSRQIFNKSTTNTAKTRQIALIQNLETNTSFKNLRKGFIFRPPYVFYLPKAFLANNNL